MYNPIISKIIYCHEKNNLRLQYPDHVKVEQLVEFKLKVSYVYFACYSIANSDLSELTCT